MISAERHLLRGRTYEQVMGLVQTLFRFVERTCDELHPDWFFSEDVSCLTSYVHWAVSRERGIPFHIIGSGKLPHRVSLYTNQYQQWERTDASFVRAMADGLTAEQEAAASAFLEQFRDKRPRPTGMDIRAQLPVASRHDVRIFGN